MWVKFSLAYVRVQHSSRILRLTVDIISRCRTKVSETHSDSCDLPNRNNDNGNDRGATTVAWGERPLSLVRSLGPTLCIHIYANLVREVGVGGVWSRSHWQASWGRASDAEWWWQTVMLWRSASARRTHLANQLLHTARQRWQPCRPILSSSRPVVRSRSYLLLHCDIAGVGIDRSGFCQVMSGSKPSIPSFAESHQVQGLDLDSNQLP